MDLVYLLICCGGEERSSCFFWFCCSFLERTAVVDERGRPVNDILDVRHNIRCTLANSTGLDQSNVVEIVVGVGEHR